MNFRAITAATLLALSSMALAQSSTSGSADVRTDASTSAGGVDITKCSAMMGAERGKCLLDARSGAAAGPTTASPGIATTTPAPLTTPSGK